MDEDIFLFRRSRDDGSLDSEYVIHDPNREEGDAGRVRPSIDILARACGIERFLDVDQTYRLTTLPAPMVKSGGYFEAPVSVEEILLSREVYERNLPPK